LWGKLISQIDRSLLKKHHLLKSFSQFDFEAFKPPPPAIANPGKD